MKKIILALIATILSLSFINAQESSEGVIASDSVDNGSKESRPLLLGVTAGVNFTTYSGDRNPDLGLGGQVGINCDIPVGEYFSIMPELIFAYKTVAIIDVTAEVMTNRQPTSTDKLLYMNVPVNVKGSMYLGIGRPFISIGPMLNVGLYGENKMAHYKLLLFQANPNSEIIEFRQKPLYNNIDFSVNFKIGYDFDFGLAVSAAFQLGLTNMYKLTDEAKNFYKEWGLETSQKSRTFSVSLGYNF